MSELVERAGRGEEIVITRRGEPVARLVPAEVLDARDEARRLVARLIAAARSVGHPVLAAVGDFPV